MGKHGFGIYLDVSCYEKHKARIQVQFRWRSLHSDKKVWDTGSEMLGS